MSTDDLQKMSYQAGVAAGRNPATPYGIQAPSELDSVGFAAGLVEGRAHARKLHLRELEHNLIRHWDRH